MSKDKPKNGVDIREMYSLIDKMKGDIMGSIKTVDDKVTALDKRFSDFELGRLTSLEVNFAEYKAELGPVKKLVYGMVSIILTGVLGAILFLVLR